MADARVLEIILKAVDKATPELESMSSKMGKTLSKLGKGLGAAAAVAGVAQLANTILATADELQNMADKTGLSAERLQELQYIGADLGVDLDTIAGAQAKLTKAMDAARNGTDAQADAFKALGIEVKDATTGKLRDAKTVMMEAVTALGAVGNETERDALALKIFGRGAQELNPLIVAGGQQLDILAQKARSSGAVMSNETVAGVDRFKDSLDHLKMAIMGRLGEAFGAMVGWLERHRGTVDSVIGGVKSALSTLWGVLSSVWELFESAWPAISGALKVAWAIMKPIFEAMKLAISGVKWVLDKLVAAWEWLTGKSEQTRRRNALEANELAGIYGKNADGTNVTAAQWLAANGKARGGLVTRPGMYALAERGAHELVLPLADRARSLSLLAQYGTGLFDAQSFTPSLAGVGGYGGGGSFGGGTIQVTTPVSIMLDGREVGRAIAQTEVHNARSGGR